jgi:hypothetical protein
VKPLGQQCPGKAASVQLPMALLTFCVKSRRCSARKQNRKRQMPNSVAHIHLVQKPPAHLTAAAAAALVPQPEHLVRGAAGGGAWDGHGGDRRRGGLLGRRLAGKRRAGRLAVPVPAGNANPTEQVNSTARRRGAHCHSVLIREDYARNPPSLLTRHAGACSSSR